MSGPTCKALCAPSVASAQPLVLPHANTHVTTLHMAEFSRQVSPGARALLVYEGADWHKTSEFPRVLDNISPLRLPPYSPVLNLVENVWD